jgi:hypothetical protein
MTFNPNSFAPESDFAGNILASIVAPYADSRGDVFNDGSSLPIGYPAIDGPETHMPAGPLTDIAGSFSRGDVSTVK